MHLITSLYHIEKKNIVLYVEHPYMYVYTTNKIVKKKNNIACFLFVNYYWLDLYTTLNKYKTSKLANKLIHLYINTFTLLIKESILLVIGKLKFFGRGFKMLVDKPFIMLRLGYSHLIFNLLFVNITMKVKKKKKKYFIFYTTNKQKLYNKLSAISQMRIPDLYTRKGAYFRKILL